MKKSGVTRKENEWIKKERRYKVVKCGVERGGDKWAEEKKREENSAIQES